MVDLLFDVGVTELRRRLIGLVRDLRLRAASSSWWTSGSIYVPGAARLAASSCVVDVADPLFEIGVFELRRLAARAVRRCQLLRGGGVLSCWSSRSGSRCELR